MFPNVSCSVWLAMHWRPGTIIEESKIWPKRIIWSSFFEIKRKFDELMHIRWITEEFGR